MYIFNWLTDDERASRRPRSHVIAEEGDETVRPHADHIIEIPAVSTLLQPLLSTVPLQVFAASVALPFGIDAASFVIAVILAFSYWGFQDRKSVV